MYSGTSYDKMSSITLLLASVAIALGMMHAQGATEPERINDFGFHVNTNMCPTMKASENARERITYEIGDILARHVCGGPDWT